MAKLIFTPAFLLLATTALVHADFQVWTDSFGGSFATSQGEFNCAGFRDPHATQQAYPDGGQFPERVNSGTEVFHIASGLCGASKLDVYHQGDVWNVYTAGGNGAVDGQCYPTSGTTTCQQDFAPGPDEAEHIFYCFSYLCK